MTGLPDGVQRHYPQPLLTTIRTGGPAQNVEVGVVESGSNLLLADAGVRGLVLKPDKELSTIELDGTRTRCGGGAR